MSAPRTGSRAAALPALVTMLVMTIGAALLPRAAWAHARLESSTPAEGSVWSSPPPSARLVFSSAVDPAPVTVSVTAPDGTTVTARPAVQNKQVTVPLPTTTSAGAYAVQYRVVSWDGHAVAGRLQFRVAAPSGSGAAPVALSPPPSSAEATGGRSLADLVPVILAVLVTTVVAWTLTIRRRGRPA